MCVCVVCVRVVVVARAAASVVCRVPARVCVRGTVCRSESDNVCAYSCRKGHEVSVFGGKKCGHRYAKPKGWASAGTALICNANSGPCE
jgi:hypothetical protein